MRITKTTIAIIIFCFFTMQLKANEPIDVSKTVRQGALQEALELIMKDLSGTSLAEVNLGLKLAMLGGIWACFSSPGHGFGRHLVEMKPTDALHLPI